MDDDDKVRRNLIVVSFAVVLYFWLELPDTLIARKLIGDEATLSGWKVWLVLVVVILYLLLRFFSATTLSKEWAAAAAQLQAKRIAFLIAHVRLHETCLRSGELPRWVSYEKPAAAAGDKNVWIDLRGVSDADRQGLSLRGDHNQLLGNDPYCLAFHVISNTVGWQGVGGIFLFVPHRDRWRLDGRFLLQMARTRYLIELAVPVLVGYAAMWLSVSALTRHLLSVQG